MKVQPVASPALIQTPVSNGNAAKARAVAAFAQASQPAPNAQPAAQVVQNQNAISVEELGAINAAPAIEERQTEETRAQEPETQPEAPKEDTALSKQFAQLARQERALRAKAQAQEQAWKAKEQAIQAREAELSAKDNKYQDYISRDQLKNDPLAVLTQAGISYDDVVQQVLNQAPKDPRVEATISRLEAKIQALEAQNEQATKTYQENQTQQYQAAVKQIKVDATNLVKSDPNFEIIRTTGSVNDVVELITQTYEKDGILLSVEEAAQEVENYLMEEATKLTKIEKIKKKLGQVAPVQSPSTKQPQSSKSQPQLKTLTNATSGSRQLSARERALLAFKGELKS